MTSVTTVQLNLMLMKKLKNQIDQIDIYLLDQILKERYLQGENILDAGCGTGRNLKWFYNNNYSIYAIDTNAENITELKKKYPLQKEHYSTNSIEDIPFEKQFFHHIICIAVLHFAKNEKHLFSFFSELLRVLKTNGTLFIRFASDIGLEKRVKHIANGVYKLPDGTDRFLLNRILLEKILDKFNLKLLEPVKTVNVEDIRCMTTLMLQKK